MDNFLDNQYMLRDKERQLAPEKSESKGLILLVKTLARI